MANLGENALVGGFLFSAGMFCPFWAKMYRLGVFYSQLVHFGHFGRKCTGWVFFILSWYILAISDENVSAGNIEMVKWKLAPTCSLAKGG